MKKSGLQKRLITSILAVSFAAGLIVLIVVYVTGRTALKTSIGGTFRELAETVSSNIDLSIEHHIEESKLLVSAQSILSAIEDSNLIYEGETNQEIEKRIQEIEARWTGGVGVNAYLFEVLNNRATNYLKDFVASGEKGIHNIILVTNEKGAVVGATEKPRHYYFGSQKWWRSAYNNGAGSIYVSDIYLNDESGVKTLDIATPVMKSGKAIGVILMSHNVDTFFNFIAATKVGNTDYVMLANSEGAILYSPVSGTKEEDAQVAPGQAPQPPAHAGQRPKRVSPLPQPTLAPPRLPHLRLLQGPRGDHHQGTRAARIAWLRISRRC